MRLTLLVIAYKEQQPAEQLLTELDAGSLSIGRSSENIWTLPDPDNDLSRRHAVITSSDSGYTLKDISSNGVFLLPSSTPIGRDNSIQLNDGDQLRMGEYQILVSIDSEQAEALDPMESTAPPTDSFDFFDADSPAASLGETNSDRLTGDQPFDDMSPVADDDLPTPKLFSSAAQDDPFDFFDQQKQSTSLKPTESDHTPALDEAFNPLTGQDQVIDKPGENESLEPEDPSGTPFLPDNWFDTDPAAPEARKPDDDSDRADDPTSDDGPFAGLPTGADASLPPAAEEDPLAGIAAELAGADTDDDLSEDPFADLTDPADTETSPPADTATSPSQPEPQADPPKHEAQEPALSPDPNIIEQKDPETLPEEPTAESGPDQQQDEPFSLDSLLPEGDTVAEIDIGVAQDENPAPTPQPVAAETANDRRAGAASGDMAAVTGGVADDNLTHFLAGAGLPEEMRARMTPETYYVVGRMLRHALQGTMDVLLARAEIKNEMRLDVTTIRAVKNNPIKFSFNVDEALQRLLVDDSNKGYMDPVDAINEAFEDIRAHQIAVLAGMQTALQSILKRFDPGALETRLQKLSPISASIPIHRQAKLWEHFQQLYEDIELEAKDDFNRLFGRAFAEAYEEQMEKLKQQRGLG